MRITNMFKVAIACAAMWIGMTSPAQAAFTVTLSDGIIADNVTFSTAGPLILQVFTVGQYSVTINASTDSPSGFGNTGTVTDNVTVTRMNPPLTGDDSTLTITLKSDGFNFVGAASKLDLANSLASSLLRGGSSASGSFVSTIDAQTSTPVSDTGSGNPGSPISVPISGSTSVLVTTLGSTFAIESVLTIKNLPTNNGVQVDAQFNTTTTATAVPVPPALALLASGIPFALVYLRRRKTA